MKGQLFMIKEDRLNEILRLFPVEMKEKMHFEKIKYTQLREIRIRVNQHIRIRTCTGELAIEDFEVNENQIYKIIEKACEYSLYSYEENMKQGFITIKGGHRIGIGGHVLAEKGGVKGLSKITFLCIRAAHEVMGCADSIMDFVYGEGRLKHTLIVSPPAYGKTTLLRDLVRQLSDGCRLSNNMVVSGKNVCVIDERSEIAACFKGVPQNNVGTRTDVLDNCPKSEGMLMAVRALSPQIIAVDEIGGIKDVEAVMYCIHCGCIVVGTVHGWNEDELLQRKGIKELLSFGAFERLIFLTGNEKHEARCVDWRGYI